MPEVFVVQAGDVRPFLPDIARLRIAVFAEFPYLYQGDLSYEAKYLQNYAASTQSLFVLVKDQGNIVGASTAIPLIDEGGAFQAPFIAAGINPTQVMYFGESVLLSKYRGHGLGHAFFDQREEHARRCGKSIAAFCAVDRDADDPRAPAGYRPLDEFWRKRGYRRQAAMQVRLSWREIGARDESEKTLSVWLRRVSS